MSIAPPFLHGEYDENGNWQRHKFCLVACPPDRCDCMPRGTPCSPNLCAECGANLNYGDCVCMTTFGELHEGPKKETLVCDGPGDGPPDGQAAGVEPLLGPREDSGVDFLQYKVLDEHRHGVAVVDCDGGAYCPRAVQPTYQHEAGGA